MVGDDEEVEEETPSSKTMGQELTSSLPTQELGGTIRDSLAEHVKQLWGQSQDYKKYKELTDSILTPTNCPILNVQRLNSKFYEKLPHNASRDKDQQQAQQQLLKAAVPIVYILNE